MPEIKDYGWCGVCFRPVKVPPQNQGGAHSPAWQPGSLDPASTDTVADLLLALNRDHGVTLIVVTHNAALAQRMGKTFELRNGTLKPPITDHRSLGTPP